MHRVSVTGHINYKPKTSKKSGHYLQKNFEMLSCYLVREWLEWWRTRKHTQLEFFLASIHFLTVMGCFKLEFLSHYLDFLHINVQNLINVHTEKIVKKFGQYKSWTTFRTVGSQLGWGFWVETNQSIINEQSYTTHWDIVTHVLINHFFSRISIRHSAF